MIAKPGSQRHYCHLPLLPPLLHLRQQTGFWGQEAGCRAGATAFHQTAAKVANSYDELLIGWSLNQLHLPLNPEKSPSQWYHRSCRNSAFEARTPWGFSPDWPKCQVPVFSLRRFWAPRSFCPGTSQGGWRSFPGASWWWSLGWRRAWGTLSVLALKSNIFSTHSTLKTECWVRHHFDPFLTKCWDLLGLS